MIYYFTGQPGSGKTSLSELLINQLSLSRLNDLKIIHIDGDDIRNIFNHMDYSDEGRKLNVRRVHDIAQFMDAKGYHVILSLVSPFRELRNELKSKTVVTEIYVHTTDDRGRNHFHVDSYEQPIENYIDMDTTNQSIIDSFIKLMDKIS